MLDKDIKQRINTARQILVGKVPDPKAQVEQITTALIYKFMDDMDRDNEELGGKAQFLTGELKEYAWGRLMSRELSGMERWNVYTRAIEVFSKSEQIPELFRTIFKGAYLPYRDAETLNLFLKEIHAFSYDNSENLGNAYEYLLSILGSQGDAGQFRTPRHIIDFIVEVVNPQKTDRILDPACGTAGFLISSYKHILRVNSSNYDPENYIPAFAQSGSPDSFSTEIQQNGKYDGMKLTPDDRKRIAKNMEGYDISPDMVRLSLVNMYLHNFPAPKIVEYDTLTYEDRWDEQFDVILANPPFMTPKGGIRPHKRFRVSANRAEVLFVDYIAEHLSVTGRAGVIVPEGIIFQTATAYKALRKMLVEDHYLYAVVSLPAGVFQPYSGVKTSILFMDKTIAKKNKEILFVKVENDGFDLGAQRRRIDKNDLGEAFQIIRNWQEGKQPESPLALTVPKSKLAENGEYNLIGNRYREAVDYSNVKWPIVELGEVCEVLDNIRKPVRKADRTPGEFPYYGATGIVDYVDKYLFDEKLVLVGEDGAKWESGEKTAFIAKGKYWVNNHAHVLRPKREVLLDELLVEILNDLDLSKYITGITVPKLNQEKLRGIKIPLPPLDVQKAIVEELDGYQKIIDGARQVVDNWKPHIKIDPEWPKVKLGDVCDKITDGSHNPPKSTVGGGAYMLSSQNIFNDEILFDKVREISEKDFSNENKRTDVSNGDVLLTIVGTIGRVAVVKNLPYNITLQRSVAVLKPDKAKIESEFLCKIIQSSVIQNILSSKSAGVAQKGIYLKELSRIEIPLPILEVQNKIVAEIESEQQIIDNNKALIKRYEQKIKDKVKEVLGEA